jgi:hypothetical protein
MILFLSTCCQERTEVINQHGSALLYIYGYGMNLCLWGLWS